MAKFGDKGAEVRAIQHALGIAVDGDFGGNTKNAVIAWQQQNRLVADGIVGSQTWGLLAKELQAKEAAKTNRQLFFDNARPLFNGRINQSQVDGINSLLSVIDGSLVNEQAYMLATAYHETAMTMQPVVEYGGVKYFDKYDVGQLAKALGNTPAKDGDGYKYRGRGYVQLTGFANYKRAGQKLNIDLVNNPDLATDPTSAGRIMLTGMLEGWFTGKKLGDYISLYQADYVNARRIINGLDKADKIAGHAVVFERALRAAKS